MPTDTLDAEALRRLVLDDWCQKHSQPSKACMERGDKGCYGVDCLWQRCPALRPEGWTDYEWAKPVHAAALIRDACLTWLLHKGVVVKAFLTHEDGWCSLTLDGAGLPAGACPIKLHSKGGLTHALVAAAHAVLDQEQADAD